MSTITITRTNRWFVVDIGDQKIHMLNQQALVYHLKKWGYSTTQRASIVHMFEYETKICIELPVKKVA